MSQNMNIDKQYIKVEMNNAIANISINGVPFIKNLDTDGFITTEPVNLWLRNGENTLSYTIYKDEDTENYTPSLSASVFIHDEKQEIPTPLETLTTIHYVADENPVYPATKVIKFKLNSKVPTKLWDEAKPVSEIKAEDKAIMFDIANKLAKSILNNTQDAVNLQKYKIQDDALAEGKTTERLIKAAEKSYEWLRSQKDLSIDTVNIEDINFNICGDGYLVNMMRKNNEEAIIIESEEMYFDVGLYFSRINGNWTIVR
jgi:hypothetical protein